MAAQAEEASVLRSQTPELSPRIAIAIERRIRLCGFRLAGRVSPRTTRSSIAGFGQNSCQPDGDEHEPSAGPRPTGSPRDRFRTPEFQATGNASADDPRAISPASDDMDRMDRPSVESNSDQLGAVSVDDRRRGVIPCDAKPSFTFHCPMRRRSRRIHDSPGGDTTGRSRRHRVRDRQATRLVRHVR